MFGANFFSQPYFGQVNAGGGIIDTFKISVFNGVTAALFGIRNTLGLVGLNRTTQRIL